jgi:hypothetical protein
MLSGWHSQALGLPIGARVQEVCLVSPYVDVLRRARAAYVGWGEWVVGSWLGRVPLVWEHEAGLVLPGASN